MNRVLRLFLLLPVLAAPAMSQTADAVFTNARVWTVDPSHPRAEAVAVRGGRILAAGSAEEMRRYTGETTRVVDCGKRLLLPGFIDDHTHFMSGGFQLQSVDLRHARSPEEFAALIRDRAARYPDRWITGGDWDHDNWAGGRCRRGS